MTAWPTPARRPDATALGMGSERLTYAELERRTNRLAHLVIARGAAPGCRVCLTPPTAVSSPREARHDIQPRHPLLRRRRSCGPQRCAR
jgi:non-ribosomal peptide synthetase component F